MTGIRDLLKKRDRLKQGHDDNDPAKVTPNFPEVTIMRSDTNSQEIINPPSFPLESQCIADGQDSVGDGPPYRHRRPSLASNSSGSSRSDRKVSSILHFRSHSRDKAKSANLPANLPPIERSAASSPTEEESQWEKRATLLAQANLGFGSNSDRLGSAGMAVRDRSGEGPAQAQTSIGDQRCDDGLQEAIRLHESGDLKASTAIFGRLADPKAADNALAQVLYGLALRHGWGIDSDLELAMVYLSRAAQNSSLVERQALASGMKKGGAAKGELVLAIFELGNCFRNGWGVEKDLVAARSYYETAANCGDIDAMVETAQCYEQGIGVKKDKFRAASYYRSAEQNGHQIVGNSWIWKTKYNEQ